MLCINAYGREYIDDCRSKVDAQLDSYRRLVAAGANLRGASKAQFDAEMRAFEPVFFNNLVLVLENYFVHRSRTIEGKNGNALNEVRVLCTSMMGNDGKLAADKQIKLDPQMSQLGYKVGDAISLRESDFVSLADAFFAEIESKSL